MEQLLWLWITLGSTLFIVLIILIFYIITLNQFKKMHLNIKSAILDMGDFINEKYTLLNKIIELSKRQLPEEAKQIVELENIPKISRTDSLDVTADYSHQLTEGIESMLIKIKNHPTLKKEVDFKKLLDSWIITEESLQSTCQFYNSKVSAFNRKIMTFPYSIVGKMNKYKRLNFFESNMLLTKAYFEKLTND